MNLKCLFGHKWCGCGQCDQCKCDYCIKREGSEHKIDWESYVQGYKAGYKVGSYTDPEIEKLKRPVPKKMFDKGLSYEV